MIDRYDIAEFLKCIAALCSAVMVVKIGVFLYLFVPWGFVVIGGAVALALSIIAED